MQLDSQYLPQGQGDRKRWGQVNVSSLACTVGHSLTQTNGKSKPFWLLITANTAQAYRLYEELVFFAPDQQNNINLFPDWEILPYDTFSPHEDIISERIGTLAKLPLQEDGALIVALQTLCHRMAPTSFMSAHSLQLQVGDEVNPEDLREKFIRAGYRMVENVYEHGEFAVRGALLDVFPMGLKNPVRIEFFDSEIETLRAFDAETQRSIETLEFIHLLPGREFPFTQSSVRTFKAQWREVFGPPTDQSQIYHDIDTGLIPSGIEYYMPLFFDETSSLVDYLPAKTTVAMPKGIAALANSFFDDTQNRYKDYNVDRHRPLLAPERILFNQTQVIAALNPLPGCFYSSDPVEDKPGRVNFDVSLAQQLFIQQKADKPWQALLKFAQTQIELQHRLLILAESSGRQAFLIEKLQPVFQQRNLGEIKSFDNWAQASTSKAPLGIMVGPLTNGLHLKNMQLHVICEQQLFGERVSQSRRRTTASHINPDHIIRDLTELKVGAPVVHIDHGVGRYEGLQVIDVGDDAQEFCMLSYANDTKLYVPVSSLHCIARYTGGDAETAPLHRLGSDHWHKERRKAAERAKDVAAELLQIYATRASQAGFAYPFDQTAYDSFAEEFPFEATPDQDSAFKAVLHDMVRTQPMDRLICGDVGFGKTEVAMRAAFIAAHAGKQVALLVPTTLLAQQHFESLRDRFSQWPVNIEVISRFKTAKEQTAILKATAQGQIDILVGTHKLLQPSIQFKNLGLVIIDEEHRFGVKHKEALKKLRANLDILAMTATPIPRTLNMSLTGMRDISIIATPPARRLAVKTFVKESNDTMRKEAILREILRGGQVFYLHNEVKSIHNTAEQLAKLVPEARVIVAHGQMRERELEKVMSDFYHQRFNLLVCTTIIETGIDVPTANTIIIDRADHFGLAQLHQLRGRVGRSHHQAYAYLLAPPVKAMTKDAIKRLEAIQEADALGAGFTLASHDLEIRGAGELLGDEQSGHIQTVGYSMFMDMLNRAVNAIKAGKTPNLDQPLELASEVNLHIGAVLPKTYIPDPQMRLILYKRLASAANLDELTQLKIEFIDRFGQLPEQTVNLMKITELKLLSQEIGIQKVELGPLGGKIEFNNPPIIDPSRIIKLIQARPRDFKLRGPDSLGVLVKLETGEERIQWVHSLLEKLASP